MAYHLHDSQLRVVHKYTRLSKNQQALKASRLILLEHVLPTTETFVSHLVEAGAEIYALIGKPYSIDNEVLTRLKSSGINVIVKQYKELDETNFLDILLDEAVNASRKDAKQIVIAEVGGYFAATLARMPADYAQYIAGVVEDTTFGHNRYLKLVADISVPVFSVARSELKEIEARFVGQDAVQAMEAVLRGHGITITGRHGLVIGYGMIGKNVAKALRAHSLSVSVYDKHDYRNLRAYIDGYVIHKKRELIKRADIIFSATADNALSFEDIEECRNGVILASVGSRDSEFDIATLKEQALRKEGLCDHITAYELPNSKRIHVARNGTAVNFLLPSIPIEVLDLVFSEIFLCIVLLLNKQPDYSPGELHGVGDAHLSEVSRDWLRNVNI